MPALDTSMEADMVQLDVYRRMSPDERLRVGLELTETSRQLLRDGIRNRHPEYDEADVHRAFLRLWLGPDLFRRIYTHEQEREP